jgi:hypothetical protein
MCLQWGQYLVRIRSDVAWVNEQNDVISKIEIGNEAQPTEQPTEVQNIKEI